MVFQMVFRGGIRNQYFGWYFKLVLWGVILKWHLDVMFRGGVLRWISMWYFEGWNAPTNGRYVPGRAGRGKIRIVLMLGQEVWAVERFMVGEFTKYSDNFGWTSTSSTATPQVRLIALSLLLPFLLCWIIWQWTVCIDALQLYIFPRVITPPPFCSICKEILTQRWDVSRNDFFYYFPNPKWDGCLSHPFHLMHLRAAT